MTKGCELLKGRCTQDHCCGLRLTLAVIGLLLALFCFGLIAADWIHKGSLYYLDFQAQRLVGGIINPTLTIFFTHVAFFGSQPLIWWLAGLIIIMLLLKKQWCTSVSLLVLVLVGDRILSFLKDHFHRARPLPQIVPEHGYSFPSGHAFYSMALYGFIIYLTCKLVRNSWLRSLIFILCPLLILLIGFSRVYLNVHWLTDVLGGFCAGFSWLMLNILGLEIIKHRRQESGTVIDTNPG
ncbi:MAG: phosphatase PAP2 family protein [Desulfobaccales bacterium]